VSKIIGYIIIRVITENYGILVSAKIMQTPHAQRDKNIHYYPPTLK